jgi:uncharacterized protein YfaA (DUF2138 family)
MPAESSPKRLACEYLSRIAIGGATVERDRHHVSLAAALAWFKPSGPILTGSMHVTEWPSARQAKASDLYGRLAAMVALKALISW